MCVCVLNKYEVCPSRLQSFRTHLSSFGRGAEFGRRKRNPLFSVHKLRPHAAHSPTRNVTSLILHSHSYSFIALTSLRFSHVLCVFGVPIQHITPLSITTTAP